MSDNIDRANDYQDFLLQNQLTRQRKMFDKPSLSECEDCGEDIPITRQHVGGITRCIGCQTDYEKLQATRCGLRFQ